MKHLTALFVALGLLAQADAASAADYPNRPVRVIVPFAPGGSNDLIARLVSAELTKMWSHSVVVENRAGAGGNIGAEAVARAAPDGHLLLLTGAGPLAINKALFKTPLGYEPERDFAPIRLIASVPLVLMVHPSLPVRSIQDLTAYARANPGKINFGSSGNGTTNHLAGELFKSMVKADMQHIPYKGSAPALQDLLGGQIPMLFDTMPSALPQVKSGAVRGLGVATLKRAAALSDLPTISESGLSGFEVSAWFGLVAPAKTPADVLKKIATDIGTVYSHPQIIARFAEIGAEPGALSLEAFRAFLTSETSKFTKIIKDSGASVDQ